MWKEEGWTDDWMKKGPSHDSLFEQADPIWSLLFRSLHCHTRLSRHTLFTATGCSMDPISIVLDSDRPRVSPSSAPPPPNIFKLPLTHLTWQNDFSSLNNSHSPHLPYNATDQTA